MAAVGFVRLALGDLPQAESAELTIDPEPELADGLAGLAGGCSCCCGRSPPAVPR